MAEYQRGWLARLMAGLGQGAAQYGQMGYQDHLARGRQQQYQEAAQQNALARLMRQDQLARGRLGYEDELDRASYEERNPVVEGSGEQYGLPRDLRYEDLVEFALKTMPRPESVVRYVTEGGGGAGGGEAPGPVPIKPRTQAERNAMFDQLFGITKAVTRQDPYVTERAKEYARDGDPLPEGFPPFYATAQETLQPPALDLHGLTPQQISALKALTMGGLSNPNFGFLKAQAMADSSRAATPQQPGANNQLIMQSILNYLDEQLGQAGGP